MAKQTSQGTKHHVIKVLAFRARRRTVTGLKILGGRRHLILLLNSNKLNRNKSIKIYIQQPKRNMLCVIFNNKKRLPGKFKLNKIKGIAFSISHFIGTQRKKIAKFFNRKPVALILKLLKRLFKRPIEIPWLIWISFKIVCETIASLMLDAYSDGIRLDDIVFQLEFANNLRVSRLIIKHGFIYVNNQKITRPSYQCFSGDTIEFNMRKEAELVDINDDEARRFKTLGVVIAIISICYLICW